MTSKPNAGKEFTEEERQSLALLPDGGFRESLTVHDWQ